MAAPAIRFLERSNPQSAPDALSIARAALEASTTKLMGRGAAFRAFQTPERVLSLGSALDAVLPDGGLAWGQVSELCVAHPSYATSVSLLACARAQAEGREATGEIPWCAFVDPFGSLYAPGVAQAGVNLERLLVVRPSLQALSRLVVRLVEAQAFALVVVDTFSHVARPIAKGTTQVDLAKWGNVVRRLNTVVANTHSAVLLITNKNAPRPLPLPVALRLELSCAEPGVLKARVAKEKHGRVTLAHTLACRDFVPSTTGAFRLGPEPVEGPAAGGS